MEKENVAKVTIEYLGQEPRTLLVYDLEELFPAMIRKCSDGKGVIIIMGTCKDGFKGSGHEKNICPKTTAEVMGQITEVVGKDLV